MYIKRHIADAISRESVDYSCILVSGARQVGKSTMLQNAFSDISYISMDDPKIINDINQDALGFFENKNYPLIIDEIQKQPQIFETIKYFVDSKQDAGMYFLSGSQRYDLMKGVSESLAGRISIFNLFGLSMREIKGDSFSLPFRPNKTYIKSREKSLTNVSCLSTDDIWQIIFKGSLPKLYENKKLNRSRYFANYINTYIERDVRQIINIGDALAFQQFMVSLAARTGQVLNLADISRDIGISKPTAKKWLSILEASNVIYLLQPYFPNVNKRIIKSPKLYFTDTGLATYLCDWPNASVLKNSMQSGGIFETFVIDEILKSYANCGEIPKIYYFRTAQKQEIDLLFVTGNSITPVEIKKHGLPKAADVKNFKVLNAMYPKMKVNPGIVICTCDQLGFMSDNCKSVPVQFI